MALRDELSEAVDKTFRTTWDVRDGRDVPESEDLALGNEAVRREEAVVFYADMAGSTSLVNGYKWDFA